MFKVGSPQTEAFEVAIHHTNTGSRVRRGVSADRASLDHPNECSGYCDTVGL